MKNFFTSKQAAYFGVFTTIFLFIHTTKIIFENTQRSTALLDVAAYFTAVAFGFSAFLVSIPVLFHNEIKDTRDTDEHSTQFYLKSFIAVLIGAGAGAGIMFGYLLFT